MLSLIIVLAAFFVLVLAHTLVRRRGESPTVIVQSSACRKTKASAFSPYRRHKSPSQQDLGQVLAYLSQLYEIPLDAGERFFVKTGLCPYWHTCIDDFIPLLCPACEWSRRHRGLIDWHGEALVKLAQRLDVQRSAMHLDLEPSNQPTGSSAVQ